MLGAVGRGREKRGDGLAQMRDDLRDLSRLGEGNVSAERLEQHAAERVDIGAGVRRSALDLLGGGVVDRAYMPATNFTGQDTFNYTATDGGAQTSQGTVRMEVTALDPLEYTKYRYTKYRYTKYRDIAQAQLTVYSFCGPRFVSVNPQVTLFEPTLVQLSAALYDVAGNRLLATTGYLANGEFGADPFQPNVLAWPDWTTPAPAGGAYVEILLEADMDTAAPYTERVTVPCAT